MASPIACASRASTGRPVSIKSRARESPIKRGSLIVPPSISGTPNRRQNTPSTASSSITRRSHHAASSNPPATAWPAIAATTGFVSIMRVGPIGPGPLPSASTAGRRLGSSIAVRSAPAQNVPPSPNNTAAR